MPETQMAVVDDTAYDTMALMPKTMQQAKEFATELSKSTLIPKHLQGKAGDCLMVTMQAYRWRMDPFVVANCSSVVHGRLMYEGKLVYAALKSMNAIEGRLEFELSGDGQSASITITGTPRGGKPQSISGTVKGWRTRTYKDDKEIPNNWDKDPLSQLVYRGTRQWARLFAPEALLGVYAPEDNFDDDAPIKVEVQKPDVPELPRDPKKGNERIEDGHFTPPQNEPAMRPPPKGPGNAQASAPAAAKQQPAPTAAPDNDVPFDDPKNRQSAPAAEPQQDQGAEEQDLTDPGPPLSNAQQNVVKAALARANLTDEQLDEKFPLGRGTGNVNAILKWLRGIAAAKAGG